MNRRLCAFIRGHSSLLAWTAFRGRVVERVRDAFAADHAGDFCDALFGRQGNDGDIGAVAFHVLFDVQMALPFAGKLREVRDTQDLRVLREVRQFFGDFTGRAPAYANVNLVKTIVGKGSCRASADLIASITREISPPDATFASERSGSPGLVAIRNSTLSVPLAVGSP